MRIRHRNEPPIALLRAGLLLLAVGCSDARHAAARADTSTPTSQPEAPMLSQRGKVTLRTAAGRELRLDVEIASDDATRTQGLMFRRSLPEMAGMVFVFPDEGHRSFWMRNTYLPLDMLFIDSKGTVVGIVENAEPLTLTSRSVRAESKIVLEVNGGFCSRHGVAPGDTFELEGMYDLR